MPRSAGWPSFWSAWSVSIATCCGSSWTRCSRWWWRRGPPHRLSFSSQTSTGRRYRWGAWHSFCLNFIIGLKLQGRRVGWEKADLFTVSKIWCKSMAFLTKCWGGGGGGGGGKELLPCKKLMLMSHFVVSRLNDGDGVNLYRATNIHKKAMLGQSLCQNNKERYTNRGRRKKDEKTRQQRMIYVWPVTSQSRLLENPSVSSTVGLTWVCSVFFFFCRL